MKIIIVSGRSGSGKSVVLNVLEDLGYYCVDNLPLILLPRLVQQTGEHYQQLAVSIDVRNQHEELQRFSELLEQITEWVSQIEVLFVDAEDQCLLKRFSETRRRHPLTHTGLSLLEAIVRERILLDDIASAANLYIDTTSLTPYQLRDLICLRVLNKNTQDMALQFESFGFKYGVPKDADFMFDARCLPNPYWEPELKPLSGKDAAIIRFFEQQSIVNEFIWQISVFLDTWVPRFAKSNRSYMTVAIGCTGGRHRSVYVAETLARHFSNNFANVQLNHRDIE